MKKHEVLQQFEKVAVNHMQKNARLRKIIPRFLSIVLQVTLWLALAATSVFAAVPTIFKVIIQKSDGTGTNKIAVQFTEAVYGNIAHTSALTVGNFKFYGSASATTTISAVEHLPGSDTAILTLSAVSVPAVATSGILSIDGTDGIRSLNAQFAPGSAVDLADPVSAVADAVSPVMSSVFTVFNSLESSVGSMPNTVTVSFDEALGDKAAVETPANWMMSSVSTTYAISSVVLSADRKKVTLTLPPVNPASSITYITNADATAHLQVTPSTAIKDLVGNTAANVAVTGNGETLALRRTISGQVQNIGGATGISGVTVTSLQNGQTLPCTPTIMTDVSGNYSCAVPYNFTGSLDFDLWGHYIPPLNFSSMKSDLGNQNVQEPQPVSVSGTIKDVFSGALISGATPFSSDSSTYGYGSCTPDNPTAGSYDCMIAPLSPSRSQYVSAGKAGYAFTSVTINNLTGQDIAGVATPLTISGTVKDSAGAIPIDEVDVTAKYTINQQNFSASTTTISGGNYTLNVPSNVAVTLGFYQQGKFFNSISLTVLSGNITQNVLAQTTYNLTGYVKDAQGVGLSGVYIDSVASGFNSNCATTAGNGSYSCPVPLGFTGKLSFAGNTGQLFHDLVIAAPVTGNTSVADVLAQPTVMVNGTVKDVQTGSPIAGARIGFWDDAQYLSWMTWSAWDGSYSHPVFTNDPVGNTPYVEAGNLPGYTVGSTAVDGLSVDTFGKDILVLALPLQLSGQVRDTGGNPLPNVEVFGVATETISGKTFDFGWVYSDGNGNYTLNAPAGLNRTISFSKPGFTIPDLPVALNDALSGYITSATTYTDVIPPRNSSIAIVNVTSQSITLSATLNEAGVGYGVILPATNATPPTPAQVAAGQDATGAAASLSGSGAMAAGTPSTFTIGGLSPSTAYIAYFVARDAASALQPSVTVLPFTTPPSSGGVTYDPGPVPTQPPPPPPPPPLLTPSGPTTPVTTPGQVINNPPPNVTVDPSGAIVITAPVEPTAAPIVISPTATENALVKLPTNRPITITADKTTLTYTDKQGGSQLVVRTVDGQPQLEIANGVIAIASTTPGSVIPVISVDLKSVGTVTTSTDSDSVVVVKNDKSAVVFVDTGKVDYKGPNQDAQGVSVYSGENAKLNNTNGQLDQITLGSHNGENQVPGDPLPQQPGYAADTHVPKLDGNLPRFNNTVSLLDILHDAIQQVLGDTGGQISYDKSTGVVSYIIGDHGYRLIPLGEIQVLLNQLSAASVTATAGGAFNLASRGIQMSLSGAVGYFSDLNQVVKTLDANGAITLKPSGTMEMSVNGKRYAGIPGVAASLPAAPTPIPGFEVDGGLAVFRDHLGVLQTLYPAALEMDSVAAALKAVDPGGNLTNNGNGTLTATIAGRTYLFLPDYQVIALPDNRSAEAWWAEGNVIYIRNSDNSAQGFRLQ
ncbi:MAG: carboxypeptidase-like regulatory domain-containing protein [Sulfuricellaceae bacterium]